MADDWQVGDLALCVDASEHPNKISMGWRPKSGGIYTVSETGVDGLGRWLDLREDITSYRICGAAWCASRFRKIRPHTPDEEDAETIRLLNRKRVPA